MTKFTAESTPTRASLLLRIKDNSPAREVAWEQFYERYAPVISSFARRMGAKSQDISDLMHEVMTGFFAVSPEFVYQPDKGRFRGYLKTCTWRVFQKRMLNKVRVAGRSPDQIDPSEIGVEETWNDVWETEKLQRALANVRDRYLSRPDKVKTFRAFEMYVLLERDADDVARDLGVTANQVHQAKTRVSQALKKEIDAMDDLT